MNNTAVQYITNNSGKKLGVVLSLKEYTHMLEAVEELEDIHLYDKVKAKKEKTITIDQYIKQRKRKKHA